VSKEKILFHRTDNPGILIMCVASITLESLANYEFYQDGHFLAEVCRLQWILE